MCQTRNETLPSGVRPISGRWRRRAVPKRFKNEPTDANADGAVEHRGSDFPDPGPAPRRAGHSRSRPGEKPALIHAAAQPWIAPKKNPAPVIWRGVIQLL